MRPQNYLRVTIIRVTSKITTKTSLVKTMKARVIIHFKQTMTELGQAQGTQHHSSVILELDLSIEGGGG